MRGDAFDLSEIKRLQGYKQHVAHSSAALGPEVLGFFKHAVDRPHRQLGGIAAAWEQIIPAELVAHTSLDGITRGTLSVTVDSSAHLYELRQLLLAGAQEQMLHACKRDGLRKISLKLGRWYDGESPGDRKLKF